MQSDINRVNLCLPATWVKVYDLNGRTFTSMSLRMSGGKDETFFVSIPLNADKINHQMVNQLKTIVDNKTGDFVFIEGILTERVDKQGVHKNEVKVTLSNIGISTSTVPINEVMVAGTLVGHNNDQSSTVSTSYRDVSTNTYKSRLLLVRGLTGHEVNSKLVIFGELKSSLNNEEKVNIRPLRVVPLKQTGYRHNYVKKNEMD